MEVEKSEFKIKLNDKYQVTADRYQYILQEVINPSSGKQYTRNVAYAATIKHLIKYLLEREVRTSEISNMQDVKRMIESISLEMNNNILSLV